MAQAGLDVGLAGEALERGRVGDVLVAQDLECDECLGFEVERAVDLGHRASADQLVEAESIPDHGADPAHLRSGHGPTITPLICYTKGRDEPAAPGLHR